MLDSAAMLAAYDAQQRPAETAGLASGVHTEVDGPITRVVGRHRGFVSAPRDLGLDGPALDALIARQRDFYAARGEAVEWKTRGHDLPADLTDRLRAAGFRPEDEETVVVGESAALADDHPALPSGVVIRPAAGDDDLRRIADLQSAVWGRDMSWLAADFADRLDANPGTFDLLLAESGDDVLANAAVQFTPGTDFAYLGGGSTLAGWRGRGIYRALVAVRAAMAARRDVRYLQVDASVNSRPILRRLGFVVLTTTTPYVWTPNA